ncbi:UDP-N-acetylglucosamine 2-epimerase [Candidatus Pelagibacter ubique]|nr:UDP-N-acetylglucosamine 2-epimerase [Candidatus Pelagibacter ubique]
MKEIIFFSGTRADYGLLKPLILYFKQKKIKTTLVTSSHHNLSKFGSTEYEITQDKIKSIFSPTIKLKNTSLENIFDVFTNSSNEYFHFLKKNKPDSIFILGDRYEVYAFAIAAYFLGIPIIHMHGGEVTQAAFDEGIRHSISKFSNLHFVIHSGYKNRLVLMGEAPNSIHNVGSTACEIIRNKKFQTLNVFRKRYKLKKLKTILVTFHPETKSFIDIKKQIKILLFSLKKINNVNIVFTYSNSDTEGMYFNEQIEKFKLNKENVLVFKSMGQDIYWNFLKHSDLVVGNSSSGIIEAPMLKTITLNIGDRQKGRFFGKSIFQSKLQKKDIIKKINKLLIFKKLKFKNAFYKKDTTKKIYKIVHQFLKKTKINKKFYDFKKHY